MMIVLGAVSELGLATHVAAQHGHRITFPVAVANLIAALKCPGAKLVLLIPPLAETRGDTLARALRRVHPRVPVALAFGPSALDPALARLLWLTSEPIADDMMKAVAQIGALVGADTGATWDDTTWELDPLRELAAQPEPVERRPRRARVSGG